MDVEELDMLSLKHLEQAYAYHLLCYKESNHEHFIENSLKRVISELEEKWILTSSFGRLNRRRNRR